MSVAKQTPIRRFVIRLFCLFIIVLIIVVFSNLSGPKFGAIVQALTPPTLPKIQTIGLKRVWPEQNWNKQLREQYHHISQGTHTLPIPLDYLLALEQPASSLWTLPFGDKGRFTDNDYLLRFGFIEGQVNGHYRRLEIFRGSALRHSNARIKAKKV